MVFILHWSCAGDTTEELFWLHGTGMDQNSLIAGPLTATTGETADMPVWATIILQSEMLIMMVPTKSCTVPARSIMMALVYIPRVWDMVTQGIWVIWTPIVQGWNFSCLMNGMIPQFRSEMLQQVK